MVGLRIRELRIIRGLTQEELAHKMGYKSKSTINKIEKEVHDVNYQTLQKFADVLGVEPNYFLEGMQHKSYPAPEVWDMAMRMMKLPKDALDNVIQYIEFLEQRIEKEKES